MQQGLRWIFILGGNNCMPSISTDVVPHTNQTSPQPTKLSDLLSLATSQLDCDPLENCFMKRQVTQHPLAVDRRVWISRMRCEHLSPECIGSNHQVWWWWFDCLSLFFVVSSGTFVCCFWQIERCLLHEHFGQSDFPKLWWFYGMDKWCHFVDSIK